MSDDDAHTCSTEELIRAIGSSLREDRRGYKNLRDMEQVTALPRSWLSWVMGPKERGTDSVRPTYKVWRLAGKSVERILNADGISNKTKNLALQYLALTGEKWGPASCQYHDGFMARPARTNCHIVAQGRGS